MTLAHHTHARWGADDRIGAANLITPESRLAALSLVTTGQVYSLGRQISAASPFLAPNQTPFVLSTAATWRNTIKMRRNLGAENDAGSNLERIEMNVHVGTHIDALGHFSIGDELYGGRNAFDSVSDHGLVDLGIENCPPIIAQGVCLDLSGLDGGPHLEAGRAPSGVDEPRRPPMTWPGQPMPRALKSAPAMWCACTAAGAGIMSPTMPGTAPVNRVSKKAPPAG